MRARALLLLLAGWQFCEALQIGGSALRSGVPNARAAPRASPPLLLEALADMVVVELDSSPAESAGGILMPTAFSDDPNDSLDAFKPKEVKYGTVLHVGPGRVSEGGEAQPAPALAAGMRVVVAPVDGMKVEPDGPNPNESVFLFKATEVWGVCAG